jgi:2-C-methyl-D-erythritol 4-phosphate cytidylyltransferase
MSVAAIVVAAGQGVRFGGPKQFALLASETVATRSVRLARSVAGKVVLVVPEHYDGDGEGADLVVAGGTSRAASVREGLAHCHDVDIVVVHDAARPLASEQLFHAVVDAIERGADGAIPGLRITDTIKRVSDAQPPEVRETIPRDDLVTVQTPQAFRREILERAHASASDSTDDAQLVEALQGRVVIVDGEATNVKITEPSDLEFVVRSLEKSSR